MHPRDSLATQSDFAKKSLPALYHYGGIFQICPICTNRKAAIITQDLHTFFPAVYIVERLVLQTMYYVCTKQENSSIFESKICSF